MTSSCWLEGRRWIGGGKTRVREPESRLCLQARPAMMIWPDKEVAEERLGFRYL